jgi:hypothetical protein
MIPILRPSDKPLGAAISHLLLTAGPIMLHAQPPGPRARQDAVIIPPPPLANPLLPLLPFENRHPFHIRQQPLAARHVPHQPCDATRVDRHGRVLDEKRPAENDEHEAEEDAAEHGAGGGHGTSLGKVEGHVGQQDGEELGHDGCEGDEGQEQLAVADARPEAGKRVRGRRVEDGSPRGLGLLREEEERGYDADTWKGGNC